MGFLVENESTSLNWRGLILNRAVRHFLEDVHWGEMDYLLIDMPPGTGDVQMGLAKMLPRADMIVVTTPAKTAQSVAVRVGNMARSYFMRIAGVIENMTAFVNEEGTVYELFGSGGGEALATELGVPLLGRIPIDMAVASGGDTGDPAVLGEGPAAEALRAIVDTIVEEAIPPDGDGRLHRPPPRGRPGQHRRHRPGHHLHRLRLSPTGANHWTQGSA